MLVVIQLKGFERLVKDLETARKRAVPYAMRDALNTSAFSVQREWRGEIRQRFVNRNKFTERSVLVDKATGTDTGTMFSRVGSVAPYMKDQEYGGIVRGGGSKKAIPGPSAAGQAPGAKRTRLVRAGNKLSAISAVKPQQRFGRRRRNAVAIAIAARKGKPFVMLERMKTKGRGLFAIRFTNRRRNVRTRLLWDVSRGSVRVPASGTLERTLKRSERLIDAALFNALTYQLRRHKILGY